MRESSQQVFGQAIDNLFFFLFTVQPRKAFIWKYKSERFQYFQIVRSSFHRKPKAVNKERQSREGLNDYIVHLELGRDSMTRVKWFILAKILNILYLIEEMKKILIVSIINIRTYLVNLIESSYENIYDKMEIRVFSLFVEVMLGEGNGNSPKSPRLDLATLRCWRVSRLTISAGMYRNFKVIASIHCCFVYI